MSSWKDRHSCSTHRLDSASGDVSSRRTPLLSKASSIRRPQSADSRLLGRSRAARKTLQPALSSSAVNLSASSMSSDACDTKTSVLRLRRTEEGATRILLGTSHLRGLEGRMTSLHRSWAGNPSRCKREPIRTDCGARQRPHPSSYRRDGSLRDAIDSGRKLAAPRTLSRSLLRLTTPGGAALSRLASVLSLIP